jgi:hypothetical protein
VDQIYEEKLEGKSSGIANMLSIENRSEVYKSGSAKS